MKLNNNLLENATLIYNNNDILQNNISKDRFVNSVKNITELWPLYENLKSQNKLQPMDIDIANPQFQLENVLSQTVWYRTLSNIGNDTVKQEAKRLEVEAADTILKLNNLSTQETKEQLISWKYAMRYIIRHSGNSVMEETGCTLLWEGIQNTLYEQNPELKELDELNRNTDRISANAIYMLEYVADSAKM